MGAEERIRVCGYGRYRMGGWVGERCRRVREREEIRYKRKKGKKRA